MHGAGKSAESSRDFNLVVRPYHQPAINADVYDNRPKNRRRIGENQLAPLVCRFLSNGVKYVEYEQRYFNFHFKRLPLRPKSNFQGNFLYSFNPRRTLLYNLLSLQTIALRMFLNFLSQILWWSTIQQRIFDQVARKVQSIDVESQGKLHAIRTF